MLTQSRLKELLHYDPETGDFIWLEYLSSRSNIGHEAGCIKHGYRYIGINNVQYSAHRLVFLYLYGKFPPYQVDHINGIKDDNKRINLRRVDQSENLKNAAISKNNTSGFVGVCWHKRAKKWRAVIYSCGKNITLGAFDNVEDAIEARKLANIKYGFHKNHGRPSK